MSKPRSPIECHNKIQFDTKAEALRFSARKFRRGHRMWRKPGHAYTCQVCGFWHITTTSIKPTKRGQLDQ